MVFWPVRTFLFSCGVAGLTATSALAQDANSASVNATSDKPVELSCHASAHKNCTPAAPPTIRVIEAPKSGTRGNRPILLFWPRPSPAARSTLTTSDSSFFGRREKRRRTVSISDGIS